MIQYFTNPSFLCEIHFCCYIRFLPEIPRSIINYRKTGTEKHITLYLQYCLLSIPFTHGMLMIRFKKPNQKEKSVIFVIPKTSIQEGYSESKVCKETVIQHLLSQLLAHMQTSYYFST
jgi:hypothetical protein